MCCVRVTQVGDRWQHFSPRFANKRLDAVQLLTEVPEFLGILDLKDNPPLVAMVAPNSSSGRVLVAIDGRGKVYLVACPDRADESELSALIGDILATGGRFWHQPYKTIAGPFEDMLGTALTSRVSSRAGKDWSSDSFRTGVERSLNQGKFPVLVVTKELTAPIQDMLNYLKNMNLEVKPLGFRYFKSNGVELAQPVVLHEKAGKVRFGEISHRERFTPVATISTKPEKKKLEQYPPFPSENVTPEQEQILKNLVRLDDLGLERRGLEYFRPGLDKKETAKGTIVVAVNPDRWPFPKPKEVIVVVNTSYSHLASYLRLKPEEIEDFLGSLPRTQRKEHRGCMLLRAAGVHEALQLVNELKALKEIASSGVT